MIYAVLYAVPAFLLLVSIVWDRLFGTFEPERAPARYGLTTNVGTCHRLRVATHEYGTIRVDVRAAASWRHRLGHVLGRPAGQPAR